MRQVVGQLPTDAYDAAQKLEGVLLKQLITASGVFKSSAIAGGQVHTDMFVETLADAVAKAGGIGIARMLHAQMEGAGKISDPTSSTGWQWTPGGRLSSSTMPSRLMPPGADVVAGASLDGPRVTSNFGVRHDPIEGDMRFHTGIDLAVPEGTTVRAVMGGVVTFAGDRGGYGKMVEIDHGNGLSTRYAHNSELLVSPGERVDPGASLARSGSTGRATGPHVHFEVRQDGRAVEPRRALNAYGVRVEGSVAGKPHHPPQGEMP